MANPFEKLLRAGEGRVRRRLQQVVKAVGALEEDYEGLTDEELRNETVELRARYEAGETLDQLMPEAFAAVDDAVRDGVDTVVELPTAEDEEAMR